MTTLVAALSWGRAVRNDASVGLAAVLVCYTVVSRHWPCIHKTFLHTAVQHVLPYCVDNTNHSLPLWAVSYPVGLWHPCCVGDCSCSLLFESQVVPAVCLALQHACACASLPPPAAAAAATSRCPHVGVDACTGCSTPGRQQDRHGEGALQQQSKTPPKQPPHRNEHEGLVASDGAGAPSSLIAALVAALLEFSHSPQLCEQQLEAGVLPVLAQLLLSESGISSKLNTQVQCVWTAPSVTSSLDTGVMCCICCVNSAHACSEE